MNILHFLKLIRLYMFEHYLITCSDSRWIFSYPPIIQVSGYRTWWSVRAFIDNTWLPSSQQLWFGWGKGRALGLDILGFDENSSLGLRPRLYTPKIKGRGVLAPCPPPLVTINYRYIITLLWIVYHKVGKLCNQFDSKLTRIFNSILVTTHRGI